MMMQRRLQGLAQSTGSTGAARAAIPPFRSQRGAVKVVAFKDSAKNGKGKGGGGLGLLTSALRPEEPACDPMFCYQCEQTMNGTGCHENVGVCGKTAEVAALQDLLVHMTKGLGCLAHHARRHGTAPSAEVSSFIHDAIFSTLTNVDFDELRFRHYLLRADRFQDELRERIASQAGMPQPVTPTVPAGYFEPGVAHPLDFSLRTALGEAAWNNGLPNVADLVELGHKTGIASRQQALGKTLVGLQELIMYGLKGTCAYAAHAEALGFSNPKVDAFVAEALAFLSSPESAQVPAVLAMALRVGETNLLVMEMLSRAHSSSLGTPTPTSVSMRPKPGKAILVSGHDMHDMKLLLEQTKGKGINVYTHGEMLPAHGYPELKKYPHLAGHYGGAWYRQKADFARFPGSILMTTNCVLLPSESYKDNLFTTNATGVPGSSHLAEKDFSAVINRALELPGFDERSIEMAAGMHMRSEVTVGFGHSAVLGVAPQVINAIQEGRLDHIFLIGGCDGSEPQRKYYAELWRYMPQTTMILTLGCGKFRIFDQDFGNLPPAADGSTLPRLLDMGQCNDAYSAVVVATELAKALNTDINSLPLSLDLSWFEQKAVAVLLTLLHLGVRNIRLGPRLPAFLTAEAVQVLVDTYNLIPAENAEADVKAMMST